MKSKIVKNIVKDKKELIDIIKERYDKNPKQLYLYDIDVSKITDMELLFIGCYDVEEIDINGWDVSSVEKMGGMFDLCAGLKNLDAFKNWDVANVTDMNTMFGRIEGLEDASGINDWDITNVENFNMMFNVRTDQQYVYVLNPVHPEFTKRAGTWSDDGTFVPNN